MTAQERLDDSSWDADKAMGEAETAVDYRAICAGEKDVGSPDERQHWALPHHYLAGPGKAKEANAEGVRAARRRFDETQGLTNREAARRHIFETHKLPSDEGQSSRPPRDSLVRAYRPGVEMRSDDDRGMPTMVGHFTKFNEWTEVESFFEGHFMERISEGAFTETISTRAGNIRVLLNHGRDPQVGNKPLGHPDVLREDDVGPWYEVPLLDTSYNRDIIPGLEAGVYGASFRFRIVEERFNKKPGESEHNPQGLPERTITKVDLYEFGPVTFPAYEGATAEVRSLTDEYIMELFTRGPGLEKLARFVKETEDEPDEERPREKEPASATPQKDVGLYVPRRKRPYWQL